MPSPFTMLLAVILAGPLSTGTADWQPVSLVGSELRATSTGPLAVRAGHLPFRHYSGLPVAGARLPAGTGALAGICFIQAGGGKLGDGTGGLPLAGAAVEIVGRRLTLAVRSDRDGYFVLALPPGIYELRWRGFTQRATVSRGLTTLVALRSGKRLVD